MDGKDARVVDYFYVIAGTSTSTGGILATMITAPNEKNLPFCAAKDIVSFYFEHGPRIFPPRYIIIFTYYELSKYYMTSKLRIRSFTSVKHRKDIWYTNKQVLPINNASGLDRHK